MLAGQFVADLSQLERRDRQALALDAADDLADQPAVDCVGFDQKKGPLRLAHERRSSSSLRSASSPARLTALSVPN
jgi:hypothetical protein